MRLKLYLTGSPALPGRLRRLVKDSVLLDGVAGVSVYVNADVTVRNVGGRTCLGTVAISKPQPVTCNGRTRTTDASVASGTPLYGFYNRANGRKDTLTITNTTFRQQVQQGRDVS